MNGLLELLTTKKWMMQPEALDAFRHIIQQNLTGHVALDAFEKKQPFCLATISGKEDLLRMNAVTAQGWYDDTDEEEGGMKAEIERFVTVLPVCGPITRNGDACSYGSVDLRNMIMEASDDEECSGIVLYINTPGGACSAVADYKYAIDYAHKNGKQVYAFVDGMAASCGMYLSALCDKRYYMNGEDQIGSIGVMAAFWTNKDGDTDKYSDAAYHELYATQSTHKNKWYRDAAVGDYADLQADLDKTCDQFHADVKAACPNVTEEHLTGKLFDARDVDGILMDGQRTLMEVIEELLSVFSSVASSAPANIEDNEEGKCKPKANSNSIINMENYPLTQSALGVEELVVTEEGTHLDASLLETMEQNLQQRADEVAQLHEQIANLTTERDEALANNTELNTMIEGLNTQIADANAMTETLNARIADLETAAENNSAELAHAQEALATAEQTIADRDAQIAELVAAPAQQEEQSSPASNGESAKLPEFKSNYPLRENYKSAADWLKAKEAWDKAHKG